MPRKELFAQQYWCGDLPYGRKVLLSFLTKPWTAGRSCGLQTISPSFVCLADEKPSLSFFFCVSVFPPVLGPGGVTMVVPQAGKSCPLVPHSLAGLVLAVPTLAFELGVLGALALRSLKSWGTRCGVQTLCSPRRSSELWAPSQLWVHGEAVLQLLQPPSTWGFSRAPKV